MQTLSMNLFASVCRCEAAQVGDAEGARLQGTELEKTEGRKDE